MNVSDTLNLAADLIEERGWTKGGKGWGDGGRRGLCIEGALIAAAGGEGWYDVDAQEFWACPSYVAVRDYLGLSAEFEVGAISDSLQPVEPLWRWNDRKGTATEVVEVLRATALIAAARERETTAVTR